MSNPNDFFNFEPSPDSPTELANENILRYLNNPSTQDGGLINAPDAGSANTPPLSFPVDQLGFLPAHRPIPQPSGLNVSDDFLEMLKANAGQLGDVKVHGAEGVEANGAASTSPMLSRTISEVTMEMLHRTPFANVANNEANGSLSVPNEVAGNGQQDHDASTISANQMVRQGELMPAPPLQQAVRVPQYGPHNTTAAPQNGVVVSDGRFFPLPLKPRHVHRRLGAQPVEVKPLSTAEPRTSQAVAEPSEEIHRVAAVHLHPSGRPSGALQSARHNNGDKPVHAMPGKGVRGGAVVRRVLKRMARRNPDAQAMLAQMSEEQSNQGSGDVKPELDAEEKRGKKRKIEGVENEEELKKLRRVRNRESVEKCRAKQRMRLEKLEEEDRALRSECELMRQMAEVFQAKWKLIAEEYQKICGKDAGECPLVMPTNTELPEVVTLPAGEGS